MWKSNKDIKKYVTDNNLLKLLWIKLFNNSHIHNYHLIKAGFDQFNYRIALYMLDKIYYSSMASDNLRDSWFY